MLAASGELVRLASRCAEDEGEGAWNDWNWCCWLGVRRDLVGDDRVGVVGMMSGVSSDELVAKAKKSA